MSGGVATLGFLGTFLGTICLMALMMLGTFAIVAFVFVFQRRRQEEWRLWAQQRAFTLSASYPAVCAHGQIDGIGVQLVTHVTRRYRRRGGSATTYQHEIIATPRLYIGDLAIAREGLWASLEKIVGGQDIQIGEPHFDRAFVVKSAHEHAARQVLTPAVRQALLSAQASVPDIFVEQGAVRVVRQGVPNVASVDATMHLLARVAATFGT